MSFLTESERVFLETIRHASPDDAPHVVFADCLKEHGECARAELIRVHGSHTRLPQGHSEKDALGRRQWPNRGRRPVPVLSPQRRRESE